MKTPTLLLALSLPVFADDTDLAKKLANPVADLISVPIQSNYDWSNEQWNVPVNFIVSQLLKIGGQPVQLFAGARYHLETPDGGPEWGLRLGITFLFPQ
jgi:hypothetical protein